MKKFLILLFALSASLQAECEVKFHYKTSQKPLWQEDMHFQYYRCLNIMSSIYRLEKYLKIIPMEHEIHDKIYEEINIMKLNIAGDPSTLKTDQ